jgi:hypothetical protein
VANGLLSAFYAFDFVALVIGVAVRRNSRFFAILPATLVRNAALEDIWVVSNRVAVSLITLFGRTNARTSVLLSSCVGQGLLVPDSVSLKKLNRKISIAYCGPINMKQAHPRGFAGHAGGNPRAAALAVTVAATVV